jgi:staphylococcal nuclease domain-containing protein 1
MPSASNKAIVKSVLSGDSIVLRGKPVNGPPPEKVVSLAFISSPRSSKQADEPLWFESRENLRKLVGKELEYSVEYTSSSGREFILIPEVKEQLELGLAKTRGE